MKTAALLLAVALAGCSSYPTPTEETRPGKLLTTAFAAPAPGTGQIFVKRDKTIMGDGNGCAHRIYVDGARVAELYQAEAVTLHVPPGDHIVSAELTTIFCRGTSEVMVVVRAGETRTMRTSATGDGNITIQPTAF